MTCWTCSTAACLIFQAAFAPLVEKIVPQLPELTTLVCLDGESVRLYGRAFRGRS